MPLNVRVEEGRSFTKTLVLEGRLDSETVEALDRELEAVLSSAVKVVVFDLSGLEYISSAGLRSLFKAQKSMKARSGQVLIVDPQPPVQKVFDIVQATDVNEVFRSVAELDAYLDAMQKRVAGRTRTPSDGDACPGDPGGLGVTRNRGVSIGLGACDPLEVASESRFSTTWAAWLQAVPRPQREHRARGPLTPTLVKHVATGWGCDPAGAAWVAERAQYSSQWELSGGLTLRF